MEYRNGTSVHPEQRPHHPPEHRHVVKPVDKDFRMVVRTVLRVIAGLVFLEFAIRWTLT
jgi:hypothetical protein